VFLSTNTHTHTHTHIVIQTALANYSFIEQGMFSRWGKHWNFMCNLDE